jgi:Tol biopolymer transport system component
MRALIATGAALLLVLLVVPSAAAGGSASPPVIAYESSAVIRPTLYVTGPDGTHKVGTGQAPSVAPDGLLISGSGFGGSGPGFTLPGLTLYAIATGRSHSFFSDSVTTIPLAWSPDSRYLAVLLEPDSIRSTSVSLAVIDTATMTAKTIATGGIRGASFAPSGPDRLVYGQANALQSAAGVNLYAVNPDGSNRRQLTSDGDSLDPLWTARGIVYFREVRSVDAVPVSFHLWLLHRGRSTQLTNVTFPAAYIASLAASADGNRLIVESVTLRIRAAYTVQLSPRRVRKLGFATRKLLAVGISRDGRTLLVERTAFPSDHGVVETIPFIGGRATRIARGDQAAWS